LRPIHRRESPLAISGAALWNATVSHQHLNNSASRHHLCHQLHALSTTTLPQTVDLPFPTQIPLPTPVRPSPIASLTPAIPVTRPLLMTNQSAFTNRPKPKWNSTQSIQLPLNSHPRHTFFLPRNSKETHGAFQPNPTSGSNHGPSPMNISMSSFMLCLTMFILFIPSLLFILITSTGRASARQSTKRD
jgi:hypothetical protein